MSDDKPVPENYEGLGPYVQHIDDRHLGGIISAVIGGLVIYFHPNLVRSALQWILDDEGMWHAFQLTHASQAELREWESEGIDKEKPADTKTVLQCACGRVQRIVAADQPGGCTEEEAKSVGWVRDGDSWSCPFCSGNEDKLRRVFDRQ